MAAGLLVRTANRIAPKMMLKAVTSIASGIGLTDPRLFEYFGSGPTYAGEAVTVDSSLQLDTVWACVRLKAQTIATLSCMFYTRDAEDFGIVDRGHPLFYILHDQPNADMTSAEFWEAMVGSLLLWGNAYAMITWGAGRVIALTPMRPDRMVLEIRSDGSRVFHYSFQGARMDLEESQVFHLKGFSLDGHMGISPVAQGRQAIASAMAAEKASGSFFRNGMRPSLVMTSPTYLNEAQRKRKNEWVEEFSGSINAGRVPLLEGGWKLDKLSVPPEDAQLLATRGFHVEQICRWFDVPPVMIGHTQAATAWGSGMEQMMLWYLQFSLRPLLKKIEQVITKSLLLPQDRQKHYAEFNVESLLRTDSAARANLYASLVDHGVKTRNEVRAQENLPPRPEANDLTVQAAMLPLQLLGEFVKGKSDKPLDPNFKPSADTPSGAGDPGSSSDVNA
jgi:HK97 family phage portal protein